MNLLVTVEQLAEYMADECLAIRTQISGGDNPDLSALSTVDKTSLVAAINELKTAISSATGINDAVTTTSSTWSSSRIQQRINSAVSQLDAALTALKAGAPTSLDTLQKIAASLGNDAAFANTVNGALAKRVRTDTPNQGLSETEKANARANIGALAASDLEADVDFLAIFRNGLLI